MTAFAMAVIVGMLAFAAQHRRDARVRRRLVPPTPARFGVPARLRPGVADAGLTSEADRWFLPWISTAGGLFAVGPVIAGSAGIMIAAVVALGPPAYVWRRRTALTARRDAAVAPLADALAASVRAGATLAAAVEAAASGVDAALAAEIDDLGRQVERGVPLEVAVTNSALDEGADLALVTEVVGVVSRHGGNAAAALERAAGTVRARQDLRRERRALAAQARASATVMIVAPLAFTIVSGVADPRTLRFLFATPAGIACLATGLALDTAGAQWMRAIVHGPATTSRADR